MRRALAGLRAARIRPDQAVRTAAALGAALVLTACGTQAESPGAAGTSPAAATTAPAATVPATTTPAPTTPATTTPATTTPAPTTMPAAPAAVAIPSLRGSSAATAQAALTRAGLRWRVVTQRTARYAAGTVLSQSHRSAKPGTVVTIAVAATPPPAPKPTPKPTPPPTRAAPAGCDPSYPGTCLKTGIGDYDCSSGSGNGPNYASGPVKVLPPDPFDLDRDGDGWGCEQG
jgi:hypothetical protein